MSILKSGLCAALTDDVIKNLQGCGVCKNVDLLARNAEDLSQQTGISYKDLMTIRRVILAKYGSPAVSGTDLYSSALSSTAILSTGCKGLDSVLEGGLYTGEVTEVVGEVAAGKTQICFSSAATTARDSGQNVVYIDTCNSFCVDRIARMVGNSSEVEKVLSYIHCISVFTIYELLEELDMIKDKLLSQKDPFYCSTKLIIVDNMASVVYPILGNSLPEGQGLLCLLGNKLKCLAVEFSMAVLITNNTVGGEGGSRIAGLGRAWSHMPHTRLMIHVHTDSGQNTDREVELVKSSRLPVHKSSKFCIEESGLTSPGLKGMTGSSAIHDITNNMTSHDTLIIQHCTL